MLWSTHKGVESDKKKGINQGERIGRESFLCLNQLTGWIALHLDDTFGFFAGFSRVEGPDPNSHLHRSPRHSGCLSYSRDITWKRSESFKFTFLLAFSKKKKLIWLFTTPAFTVLIKKRVVWNCLTLTPPCKHPSHATSCYFKAITGNTLNSTCMPSPCSKVSVIQSSSFEAYKQICFHCLVFFPERRGANTKKEIWLQHVLGLT